MFIKAVNNFIEEEKKLCFRISVLSIFIIFILYETIVKAAWFEIVLSFYESSTILIKDDHQIQNQTKNQILY